MKKYLSWYILLILFSNVIFANENICQKPDEYLLKCNFDETLYDKSFTCIDENCNDKLYTIDKTLLLADFKINNYSVQIIKNQVNLNEISKNLELVKILCDDEISDTLVNVFDKKVSQTKSELTQSFTGDYLTIQKENKIFNKKHICYETTYEKYLGFNIETKQKKSYCNPTYNKETQCFKQNIKSLEYLKYTYKNPTELGINIILSLILAVAFLIGVVGFITHLVENKMIKDFLKIDNQKIMIMAITFIPIFYGLGKIIDLIFQQIYITSNLLPVIILLSGILFTFLISSTIHFTFLLHKKEKKKNKIKKQKKILKQKKRI